jgi:hypothetical protein
MTKPDFSDFYRFIASLGIILISLAFFIPWLFLHETFDTQITVDNIKLLTSEAQALIGIRQRYALILTQNIGWISITIGGLGIVLFLAGIYFWWSKKQTVLDEKENLELEKLRHDVAQLSPVEIAKKAIRELAEVSENAAEKSEVAHSLQSINWYFEVESTVTDKLKECFGDESLLTNRKVGKLEIDAILLARQPRRRDVVIEIKSMDSSLFTQSMVLLPAMLVSKKLQGYIDETKRKSIGVAIFVLYAPDNNYNEEIVQQYKDFAASDQQKIAGVVTRVFTLKELKNLKCSQFAPLIDFDLYE